MIYYYSRLIKDEPIKSDTINMTNIIPVIDLSLYQDPDLLKRDAKKILRGFKIAELNSEYNRLSSRELNSLEKIYLEALNEIRFEKLYPNNPGKYDLFKEVEWMLISRGDFQIVGKNEIKHTLTVVSNDIKYILSLIKHYGEYCWFCKRSDNPSIQFSHNDLIQSKGNLLKI
jgi:hypothetical protein